MNRHDKMNMLYALAYSFVGLILLLEFSVIGLMAMTVLMYLYNNPSRYAEWLLVHEKINNSLVETKVDSDNHVFCSETSLHITKNGHGSVSVPYITPKGDIRVEMNSHTRTVIIIHDCKVIFDDVHIGKVHRDIFEFIHNNYKVRWL